MKTKNYLYSETENNLNKLQEVMMLVHRADLDAMVKACFQKVRNYRRNNRQGAYEYIEHYPCGYQDSFCDNVTMLFKEWEVLKSAKRLRNALLDQSFDSLKRVRCLMAVVENVQFQIEETKS